MASGVQGAAERLVAAAAPGQPCRIRLSGRQCDMEKVRPFPESTSTWMSSSGGLIRSKRFCWAQVQAGMHLAQHTGNTYTASLWCGLASLVAKGGQDLEGSKVSFRLHQHEHQRIEHHRLSSCVIAIVSRSIGLPRSMLAIKSISCYAVFAGAHVLLWQWSCGLPVCLERQALRPSAV